MSDIPNSTDMSQNSSEKKLKHKVVVKKKIVKKTTIKK